MEEKCGRWVSNLYSRGICNLGIVEMTACEGKTENCTSINKHTPHEALKTYSLSLNFSSLLLIITSAAKPHFPQDPSSATPSTPTASNTLQVLTHQNPYASPFLCNS